MARRYSKKNTRKTRIMLSPKDAAHVIEAEFTDKKGNKIYLDIDLFPHLPNRPMFEWYRDYNEKGK